MAKPPANNADTMPENGNDSPAGDPLAPHWTELTDMGDHMMQVGSQMSKLGKERSKPHRQDLAEIMRLGSQMMRVGSLFLQEATHTTASASKRASKRKSWPATASELGPNGNGNDKSTRLSKDHWKDPDDTTLSATSGGSKIDEHKVVNEPFYHLDFCDNEVDPNFWNESSLSDLWKATQTNIASTTSDATVRAGAATDRHSPGTTPFENDPSSDKNWSHDKKQGRFKKATYPNKLWKASTARGSGPNSDNEHTLFGTNPVPFAQSPGANPSCDSRPKIATKPPSYRSVLDFEDAARPHTEDDAGSPTPGDTGTISLIDKQMLEPLNFEDTLDGDLDIHRGDEFTFSDSEFFNAPQIDSTSVAADSCASAARDHAGPGPSSVKNGPPSGKGQSRDRKQGKGKKLRKASYLNRLVANTAPKMPLAAYLQGIDGRLVCLCGRGGHWRHHAGNKDYLDLIQSRLQRYRSLSRKGKEDFTNALVQELEEQGRRFLRVYDNEWEEMDRLSIRRKVSQNFRDACDTGTAQSNSDGSPSPPAA